MWFRVSRVRVPLPTPLRIRDWEKSQSLFFLPTQGCRQVVRQGTLTPSSAGSSPAIPAKHFRMAPHPVIYYAYAPLAQSVEHLPFKQGVWGSNPQRGTKKDATRSGGVFFGAPLSKKADGLFGQMNFAPNRAFSPPWAGKTHSGPTSTVGSAEASSFGPRPAPRKVFFATYTPPQKTDYILFAALRRRELCETFCRQLGPHRIVYIHMHSALCS